MRRSRSRAAMNHYSREQMAILCRCGHPLGEHSDENDSCDGPCMNCGCAGFARDMRLKTAASPRTLTITHPPGGAVVTGEGGPFRPAGKHHNREHDVIKGRSRKPKHKRGTDE
jgi:hypothetical protein